MLTHACCPASGLSGATACLAQIIGIMVCFFGLSAGIFSQIFKGFCGGDVTTLLAVLALGIPVTGFAAASVMTLVPRAEVLAAQRRARSGSATLAVDGFGGSDPMGEPRAPVEVYDPLSPAEFTARTHTALGIVVLMILVIGGSSVVNAVDSSSPPFAFAVALVVLLGVYTLIPFMPLRLLQVVTLGSHRGGAAGLTEMDAAASSPLLGKEGVTGPTAGTDADEGGGTQSSASVPLENTLESPLLTTLRTLDFWLLLLAFMCCIGASVASVDNLDRIVDSKASPTSSKQWRSAIKVGSTGIFSVFNTLGRLLVGFLSDRLSRHVSRAAFLVTACFTMLVSQVWLAFATPDMVRRPLLRLALHVDVMPGPHSHHGAGHMCVALFRCTGQRPFKACPTAACSACSPCSCGACVDRAGLLARLHRLTVTPPCRVFPSAPSLQPLLRPEALRRQLGLCRVGTGGRLGAYGSAAHARPIQACVWQHQRQVLRHRRRLRVHAAHQRRGMRRGSRGVLDREEPTAEGGCAVAQPRRLQFREK